MLRRDQDESRRLDVQHQFLRALAHGHLIQPSVPKANLRAIADVGTGTGVWLREVAEEMTAQAIDLKGFDISSQQFPSKSFEGPDCKTPNTVEYIVQDVVDPFPQQYHQTFDLVHVRLMTYALKAKDLTNAVKNVVDIIRAFKTFSNQAFSTAQELIASLRRTWRLFTMARMRHDRCLGDSGH